MAIRRQMRINLAEYDPSWNESYIILYSKTYEDIERAKIKADELAKRGTMDDGLETIKVMIQNIEDSFVKGIIFDSDLNQNRELVKEDIKQLPLDVIRDLNQHVMGFGKKKSL